MDEKRCMNCIWRNSQPNESGMVYCNFFHCGVYAHSLACKNHEWYDHRDDPF